MTTSPTRPGSRVVFMKVGTHAQENLNSIVARKQREITETGFAMWGYGGNTCHPRTMLQPFAKGSQEPLVVLMQEVCSKHMSTPTRATQYSENGTDWLDMPDAINVLGSKYALILSSIKTTTTRLRLGKTFVDVGPSRGQNGALYLRGRIDKACLSLSPEAANDSDGTLISLAAELLKPYAVFVR